jgi:hypothetical protein
VVALLPARRNGMLSRPGLQITVPKAEISKPYRIPVTG